MLRKLFMRKKLKIALLDDDCNWLAICQDLLWETQPHVEVTIYHYPEEEDQFVKDSSACMFDILFIDLMLDETNGALVAYKLLSKIKTQPRIFVMSAWDDTTCSQWGIIPKLKLIDEMDKIFKDKHYQYGGKDQSKTIANLSVQTIKKRSEDGEGILGFP